MNSELQKNGTPNYKWATAIEMVLNTQRKLESYLTFQGHKWSH